MVTSSGHCVHEVWRLTVEQEVVETNRKRETKKKNANTGRTINACLNGKTLDEVAASGSIRISYFFLSLQYLSKPQQMN